MPPHPTNGETFMSIYFLDDWNKFPNAIVDTKTRNRSFVEVCDKYRLMGIKNYFFPLALMQPELQGVDPFDENLSVDLATKIIIECKYNPWYFFREVFRLPSQGSSIPDALRANRANIAVFWLYYNHIDVGVTHSRQTGKSVGADGINTHVTQVAGENTTFTLFTKDHDLRSKNVQRLKDMRDALPSYLNQYDKGVDSNNPFGLTVKARGNVVLTGVAQANEAQALNAGRGMTSESNQIDEPPFCKNIHITIPAFLASAGAARENAAKHGSFYGNIYTTTAGKLDTPEGAYMYSLLMGGIMFDEKKLYDLSNREQLVRVVEVGSKNKPLVYVNMNHRQLGYTDEWLYRKMLESDSKGDAADRDFMGHWTVGSLRSPLSPAQIAAMKSSEKQPLHVEVTKQCYLINWYVPQSEIVNRMSRGKIILGNDTSEAVGADAITVYAEDPVTLETIFTIEIKESNIYSFCDWFVDEIMVKYPNTILVPERKSVGVTLIDTVIIKLIALGINPFKRVYNIVVDEGWHESKDEFMFIHRDPFTWSNEVPVKYKKMFGYGTAGSGRHKRDNLYVDTLTRAVDLGAKRMYDNLLIKQLSELVVKNGRIDHPVKGHDDMAIAFLLSKWFLLHSKHIDYYGVTDVASKAMSISEEAAKAAAPTGWAKVVDNKNTYYLDSVNKLLKELESEEDEYVISTLESRIWSLSRRINSEDMSPKSINEFLKQSREARERKFATMR